MSSKPPSSTGRPRRSSRLVVHDIRLDKSIDADGSVEVKALVECEREGAEIAANECARCPRFVRIEPHEAGYVLLCHAEEAAPDESAHPTDARLDEGED